MIDTAGALYRFFSSFGIPAFVENTVPDLPQRNGIRAPFAPPYITYELKEPEPLGKVSLAARVWYLDSGFAAVTAKVKEIKSRVVCAGQNGLRLPAGDGYLCLWPDAPFCQFQPPDEPKIKIAYLLFVMAAYKT